MRSQTRDDGGNTILCRMIATQTQRSFGHSKHFFSILQLQISVSLSHCVAESYILGEASLVSGTTEYTTGSVELEGRTPAPDLLQVCSVPDSNARILLAITGFERTSPTITPADNRVP